MKRLGSDGAFGYQGRMNEIEQDVLMTLTELDTAVKAMAKANPKPNLLPLFARIDTLARQLPLGTDPSLRHYLHKQSYEKARLFLVDREAENVTGNCDRD